MIGDHIQSARPCRDAHQLVQLKAALESARTHLECIPRHNALAIGIQQKIIAQYEQRIKQLTEDDSWLI